MRRLTIPAAAVVLLAVVACADPEGSNDAGSPGALPDPEFTAQGIIPLAKAAGWRDGFGEADNVNGVIEIAFDADTAERAWRDNVPADLPEGDGVPAEPAIYHQLDWVDFEEQAVVVWSSGESGTCPAWLADVDTGADGRVEVEVSDTAQLAEARGGAPVMCTMDYRPYRMVLAVDRDRLPDPDDLPYVEGSRLLVTAYPAG
jgi:hypothetical protein